VRKEEKVRGIRIRIKKGSYLPDCDRFTTFTTSEKNARNESNS